MPGLIYFAFPGQSPSGAPGLVWDGAVAELWCDALNQGNCIPCAPPVWDGDTGSVSLGSAQASGLAMGSTLAWEQGK